MAMSSEIRAAWIGVAGSILGTLLGVFGTIRYQALVSGPSEGSFGVDVTPISASDINPAVREQVQRFPVTLRIVHLSGPAIRDLTANISSKFPLSDVRMGRNDEQVQFKLSADAKILSFTVPQLRKGSVIESTFISNGNPQLERSVQVASGVLLESTSRPTPKPWYESTIVLIVAFVVGAMIISGAVLYFYSGFLGIREALFRPANLGLLATTFLVSLIPYGDGLLLALLILAVLSAAGRLSGSDAPTPAAIAEGHGPPSPSPETARVGEVTGSGTSPT